MSEIEKCQELISFLDGKMDPSDGARIAEVIAALSDLSQGELDHLLILAGMSPSAVRRLVDAPRRPANGRSTSVGRRYMNKVAADGGCACDEEMGFSLAREVAHGFRRSEKRLVGYRGRALAKRAKRKNSRNGCDLEMLTDAGATGFVQRQLAQIVAHRDKDERLGGELDFE
ncbi:hypothetical protein ACQR0V_11725 [Bradyrhizobium sp. HKCCYLS2058]|uniref:hypothetical protein n=1 Tax=unclassified Bradyrhizobium TaxID=2631580 RepID=UPI003EBFA28E